MTEAFERVADFVLRQKTEAFPESARDWAALLLLDTLGVAIAAAPMQAGRIARDTACLLYAAGDPAYAAPLLFDGRRASLAGAAYALASQIDNLDGHDGYNPVKGHIGVVVAPVLAALAETMPELAGPDALAAAVVGYEVAGRAGLSLHASVSDYHTSGAWNALGVLAMAARLRGHSDEQLRQGFGIAEYHGPRSQMMREIDNPTMLHDGSGWGALVGLSAAVLAEQGFTGAPAITIEAEAAAPHWQDLGRFWQIEKQYIKPYPICRWAHAAIDAARKLRLAHGFAAADVQAIEITSFHEAACLYPAMPDSTSQAQYSLPFAVANMVAFGEIGLRQISDAGLSDPTVAGLVRCTQVAEAKRHQDRFPAGRWADVAIVLNDGQRLESGDTPARGGLEDPLSREEIIDKFFGFATSVVSRRRAAEIADATLGLTRQDSRFSELAALLHDPV
ncbi:MAG: MmgE/PrpD family protein [Kiloniellales bacterium]